MTADAGQTAEHRVNTKRKRRWFQYSLRTMLMLAFGCGLGWVAQRRQNARTQRDAAAAIRELGGRVMYAGQFRRNGLPWEAVAWLGMTLSGAGNMVQVDLERNNVSDAGLVHLRGLKWLKDRYLTKTRVTDAGVNELQKALPNVKIER